MHKSCSVTATARERRYIIQSARIGGQQYSRRKAEEGASQSKLSLHCIGLDSFTLPDNSEQSNNAT